jgi:hypothetical protein
VEDSPELTTLPSRCGDVLCVALTARAVRQIVSSAGDAPAPRGSGFFVLAADSPYFAWAASLAGSVGLEPCDLPAVPRVPLRIAGVAAPSVWTTGWDGIAPLVDANLGEGRFAELRIYLGCRYGRRSRRLVADIRATAARHGVSIQVIEKERR